MALRLSEGLGRAAPLRTYFPFARKGNPRLLLGVADGHVGFSEFLFAKAPACDPDLLGQDRQEPEEGCSTLRAEVTLLIVVLCLVVKSVDLGFTRAFNHCGSVKVG